MPKKDDLTNVPAAVLKQQREAERLIKKAADDPDPPAPEPAQDPPISNTDPPAPIDPTPPATPEPVAPAINDGVNQDGQWEHKYNVLQGKYNKELGDLNGIVVDLKAQLERQDKVIQGLNSQQSEPSTPEIKLDDLNPDDYNGWGDEMKDMVKQLNSLKAIINDQNQIITGLKSGQTPSQADDDGLHTRVESLESEIHDGRISSYLKFLDDNIKGDWRVINKHAGFNAWLAHNDPISMQPRMVTLQAAAEQLRGAQVASIFNLYLQEAGDKVNFTVADELPNGSANFEPNPDKSGGETITNQDVKNAQSDFVQGRITEEEFDKVYAKYQATLRRQQS